MDINVFLSEVVRLNASDLHLITNYPPTLRIAGNLEPIAGARPLSAQEIEALIFPALTGELKDLFLSNREVDFSFATPSGRFRANVYFQRGSISGTFRYIVPTSKSMAELGLPEICHEFVKLRQGLILVTGPTGHGKSTTLTAMIQEINQTKPHHIITIEDPIEFVYPVGMSLISQREMHGDTHSWTTALRSALREDPDVVLIGEMRDFETIQAALTVAETGHLVFATLHTNSASQSVDRIVGVFPEHQQAQIQLQLASTLEAIISQRLIPAIGGGRSLAAEIVIGTPAVRATIREGRTHLIDNIIQTSADQGMVTLEMSLVQKVKKGEISTETAMSYSLHPEELIRLLKSY